MAVVRRTLCGERDTIAGRDSLKTKLTYRSIHLCRFSASVIQPRRSFSFGMLER
jgi:hypothetical protein